MYNQMEAILAQYELTIGQITKGRGNYICETDAGRKILTTFRGSGEKGEFLKRYLEMLEATGYPVEQIYGNKDGAAVTTDEVTNERFVMKDWKGSVELSTVHSREMIEAAAILAEYHLAAERVIREGIEIPEHCAADVVESRSRHYRELVKVRGFIRSRKKKTEFEGLFMEHIASMIEAAEKSLAVLREAQQRAPVCLLCHGDYNQHNVVYGENRWWIVNFENITYNWATWDLANYMRKLLEKNEWDRDLGLELLRAYEAVRPLGEEGHRQLYGLLLFPEKFWKITNHYMNSNKAWISARDIEKMQRVIEQEGKRLDFVENLFSFPQ